MQRAKAIFEEITKNMIYSLREIDEVQIEKIVDSILTSKKIFVLGKGQSGLMGKILAMKLAHLGFISHVVGDVTAPPLEKDDLLVAISQSGETSSIVTLVKKAKDLGGRIIGITSYPDSTLGQLAHIVLKIPGKMKKVEFPVFSLLGDEKHKNMSGALFAANVFAVFYGIVCELVAKTGQSPQEIDSRHANLE